MVGYAIQRVALSETRVPCGTKKRFTYPGADTDRNSRPRKEANYGLHLPHGVYPADVASSLDANCIWFFSAGRLLQVGMWNT